MSKFFKMVVNRSIRLVGNLVKAFSYLFHLVFPNLRFVIPEYSKAKLTSRHRSAIPNVIWQTNYSNRCTLPVYVNYLFNRLMSLDCDYRYVSTEAREAFLRDHAPADVYHAYLKLNDGAAQADLWRVVNLHLNGGIYMDIDASLVWPISQTLKPEYDAFYIKFKKNNTQFTNFFLATKPGNQHYQQVIEKIVSNITHYHALKKKGVYNTTGPTVLNHVLEGEQVHSSPRGYVCIQGAFTNEYFQYLDKPKGKWTHLHDDDLIKAVSNR
ncbi:glycosyltransferase family 32 protein [Marinomonas pollencensis]|uniref:Mannosyltransferase OCH1-like enzyme n=1 Tax=Marinomonas pollencensis TaxID=491954 RepID=A0A3E0DQ14_9GAMM|nr:glycosyltransferase [Marinomonas pollencensis]REG84332.1 mannosyltransferase OCH1-like enzyme [Marinomonas pollencensis]